MGDFVNKHPLNDLLRLWKLMMNTQIDPKNQNIMLVFTTKLDWPFILRMRGGYNHT